MRKLRIQLGDLQVESFETVGCDGERGTVVGNIVTPKCDTVTGGACDSCFVSCNYTPCPADCMG